MLGGGKAGHAVSVRAEQGFGAGQDRLTFGDDRHGVSLRKQREAPFDRRGKRKPRAVVLYAH